MNSWFHDVRLLAWREVLNLLRDPQFWMTLLLLPLLMFSLVAVTLGITQTMDGYELGKRTVVFVDHTEALAPHLPTFLDEQYDWRLEPAEPDPAPRLREAIEAGEIGGIMHLRPDALEDGTLTYEAANPSLPQDRRTAFELAVYRSMTADRLGERAPELPSIEHVWVGGEADGRDTRRTMRLLFFAMTCGIMLLPVMTAGSMAAGLLRDRRCGFSSVLVCAAEPYRVFVGQLLGGGVMALAVGVAEWATLAFAAVMGLMYGLDLQPSASATSLSAVPEIDDAGLAELGTMMPEVMFEPMVWVTLLVLTACGSASWWAFSLLTLVGVRANDRTVTTVDSVWVGVYSLTALLAMVALQDPGGLATKLGYIFPGAFMLFAWMEVVWGVWDLTTVLACVLHAVATVAALRLAATAYVTDEVVTEIVARWWRLRRQPPEPAQ